MLFNRKGKIRAKENEKLLAMLEEMKGKFLQLQKLVTKSVDPSPYVIYEMKLTEAKYLFLLREVRHRQITLNEKRS